MLLFCLWISPLCLLLSLSKSRVYEIWYSCNILFCLYPFVKSRFCWIKFVFCSSLETQGQIVGARESLNGRKNMARRKVKNGEKSPWGQCLAKPVPNGRCHSDFWLVQENFCVFLPNQKAEWRRLFETGLVRHCPQGLFSPFFTFLCAMFFHPFRLSLAPTICPWVSKDVFCYSCNFFTFRFFDNKNNNLLHCTFAIFCSILEGPICLSSS